MGWESIVQRSCRIRGNETDALGIKNYNPGNSLAINKKIALNYSVLSGSFKK